MQALAGTTLGPFRFLAPLGQGAMGEVWEAEHLASRQRVAIKLLLAAGKHARWAQDSFANEVRAVAGLDHPGVVMVLDHGLSPEGVPYLVMERLHAQSLHAGMAELDWPQVREVLRQLLEALAHAHARGVIHRDLKPGNVLLERQPLRAVLTDFGLAQAIDDKRGSRLIAGTPAYMAPEQLEGRWRDQGPWTDLYSLGCLAWALVAGDPPFGRGHRFEWYEEVHRSSPPPRLRPRMLVPPGLEAWLGRLLAKAPRERFQRAAQAARGLEALEAEPSTAFPDWRGQRRRVSPQLTGVGLNLYALRRRPLVGRLGEREVLWEALGRVVASSQQEALLVEGPAGCGKTALMEWLCWRAEELGVARVLRLDLGEGTGLEALVEGAFRLSGLSRERVAERLEALGELREPLATLLRPGPGARQPRPAERHALLARVLRWLCAGGQPWIVVLDQVDQSRDALAFVQRLIKARAMGLPLLFVMALRTESTSVDRDLARAVSLLEDLAGAQALVLEPLPAEEHRALVAQLLGLDGTLVDSIARRTEGNPRFAVQLVADQIARGLLEAGEQGFRLRPGARIELPQDLQQVWGQRLERLLDDFTEPEARALELAAVLGMEVDRQEWRMVCRLVSLPPRSELVARLYEERLAVPGQEGQSFRFLHAMFREALVQRARSGKRLLKHHRACVVLLEARDDPRTALRMGRHLLLGGQPDQALQVLLDGAQRCLRLGDSVHARPQLEYRQRALAVMSPAQDLRWAKGQALMAELEFLEEDYRGSLGSLEELETLARERGWGDIQAACLHLRSRHLRRRGELGEALRALAQAVELGRDRAQKARIRRALGVVLMMQGRPARARLSLRHAEEDYERLGDFLGMASCRKDLGRSWLQEGQLEEARQCFLDAREGYREAGASWSVADCHSLLGEVARASGDLDGAEASYRAALEGMELDGHPNSALPRAELGLVLVQRERFSEARSLLEGALPELQAATKNPRIHRVRLALLACAAAEGRWADWDSRLDVARKGLEGGGDADLDSALLAELAGELALSEGQADRAVGAYEIALAQQRALKRPEEVRGLEGLLSRLRPK